MYYVTPTQQTIELDSMLMRAETAVAVCLVCSAQQALFLCTCTCKCVWYFILEVIQWVI